MRFMRDAERESRCDAVVYRDTYRYTGGSSGFAKVMARGALSSIPEEK